MNLKIILTVAWYILSRLWIWREHFSLGYDHIRRRTDGRIIGSDGRKDFDPSHFFLFLPFSFLQSGKPFPLIYCLYEAQIGYLWEAQLFANGKILGFYFLRRLRLVWYCSYWIGRMLCAVYKQNKIFKSFYKISFVQAHF